MRVRTRTKERQIRKGQREQGGDKSEGGAGRNEATNIITTSGETTAHLCFDGSYASSPWFCLIVRVGASLIHVIVVVLVCRSSSRISRLRLVPAFCTFPCDCPPALISSFLICHISGFEHPDVQHQGGESVLCRFISPFFCLFSSAKVRA